MSVPARKSKLIRLKCFLSQNVALKYYVITIAGVAYRGGNQ